jgi:hypothetical protein
MSLLQLDEFKTRQRAAWERVTLNATYVCRP